jgi:hypothetical protein
MKVPALLTAATLYALPFSATAASLAPPGSPNADPLSVAGLLAMGLGFFILAIVLYLSFFAIFVHAATRIVGLHRPFSTAFYAVVLNIVFQFAFSIIVSLLSPGSDSGYLLVSWAAATVSIKVAYNSGFLQALGAAVLAVILTIVFVVAALLILFAVFSKTAPAGG